MASGRRMTEQTRERVRKLLLQSVYFGGELTITVISIRTGRNRETIRAVLNSMKVSRTSTAC